MVNLIKENTQLRVAIQMQSFKVYVLPPAA